MNTKELKTLESKTNKAYDGLLKATAKYQEISETVIIFETELKNTILAAYASGIITGKNVTERDAAEREFFGKQYGVLEELKQAERQAKYSLESARISVEHMRALLRIAEITNGTNERN